MMLGIRKKVRRRKRQEIVMGMKMARDTAGEETGRFKEINFIQHDRLRVKTEE